MAPLRDAEPADLAAVLTMNNAAVPAVNELTGSTLADLVTVSERLVVAGDADLEAFLLLLTGPGLAYDSANYRWFSARFSSFLYVDRVVVGDGHRGRGLGRRLYEHAVELGRDRFPVLCAEVNVRPRNDASLAFHEAMGFRSLGEQDTEGGAKRVVLLARDL